MDLGKQQAVQEKKQVQGEMNRCNDIICEIAELSANLEKRLNDILANEPTAAPDEPAPGGLVPLAMTLFDNNTRLGKIRDGLGSILQRIEL